MNNTFSVDWDNLTEIMKRLKPVVAGKKSTANSAFHGINFRVHTDGRLLATALDGVHQASLLYMCPTAPAEYTEFTILPFRTPKAPKYAGPVVITVTDDRVHFSFDTPDGGNSIDERKLDGDYLNLSRVLPDSIDAPSAHVFVNPEYLMDAAKAAANAEKVIELRFYEGTRGLLVMGHPGQEAMVLPINPKTATDTADVLYAVRKAATHD